MKGINELEKAVSRIAIKPRAETRFIIPYINHFQTYFVCPVGVFYLMKDFGVVKNW